MFRGHKSKQTIFHTVEPYVVLLFLLSSRLYCRFWNFTKSAATTSHGTQLYTIDAEAGRGQ